MGVPTFYRWLCCRYPRVVVDVGEGHLEQMREELRLKKQQEQARKAATTKKHQQKQQDEIIEKEKGDGEDSSPSSTDHALEKGNYSDGAGSNEAGAAAAAVPTTVGVENDDEEEVFGYDCLYLDMNGIIHPCCHTDDGACPSSEEEMFLSIFQYIDRIVDLIQPRQLLYMAIDGVAPRAKMNQQRSRRFKTAKEIEEEERVYEDLKESFLQEGRQVPPKKQRWDSNVITPGTPFMHRLSHALSYYIQDRLASRESWKKLKVIFSDATVPGEGEHKIMDFIRQQRKGADYRPNMRHVLHGADADLIMLGLASHEPNFCILREAVVDRVPVPPAPATDSVAAPETPSDCLGTSVAIAAGGLCRACSRAGVTGESCVHSEASAAAAAVVDAQQKQQQQQQQRRGLKRHFEEIGVELPESWAAGLESHRRAWKPLQMLQLPILREYLEYELVITQKREGEKAFDLERCIDDFVFLCFLCGNDFLPHLPHQSIQRGSIDALVALYLHLRPHTLTDYLTKEGTVNFQQLETFLQHFSLVEEEVVRRDLQRKSRLREKNAQQQQQDLLSAARAVATKLQQEKQQSSSSSNQSSDSSRGAAIFCEDAQKPKEEALQPLLQESQEQPAPSPVAVVVKGGCCMSANESAAKLLKSQLAKRNHVADSHKKAAPSSAVLDGGGGGPVAADSETVIEVQEEVKTEGKVLERKLEESDCCCMLAGTNVILNGNSSSSVAAAAHSGCDRGDNCSADQRSGRGAEKQSDEATATKFHSPRETPEEAFDATSLPAAEAAATGGGAGESTQAGDDHAEDDGDTLCVSVCASEEGAPPPLKRLRLDAAAAAVALPSETQPRELQQSEYSEEASLAAAGLVVASSSELFSDEAAEARNSCNKKMKDRKGGVGGSGGKEADYDMFKVKMTEQLNSAREIDSSALLLDAVDGGAGCQNRTSWRALYYRKKFHLPLVEDDKQKQQQPQQLQQQQQRTALQKAAEKASTEEEIEELASHVANSYLVGLQWVLYYYYQGCKSYGWFYPFHYAPLAVDLFSELHRQHAPLIKSNSTLEEQQQAKTSQAGQGSIDENGFFKVTFDAGHPFSAFEQLMAVLPPYSAGCLPAAYAALMRDPVSSISDFYPSSVKMDPNGKRYQWQWVVLLPFIDEERLLARCKPLEITITDEERERNMLGSDQLYVHRTHPLAPALAAAASAAPPEMKDLYDSKDHLLDAKAAEKGVELPVDEALGFTGRLLQCTSSVQAGGFVKTVIEGLPDIQSAAFCCLYSTAQLPQSHRSVLLKGVRQQPRVLDKFDLDDTERRDRAFSGAVARRVVSHCLQLRSKNNNAGVHTANGRAHADQGSYASYYGSDRYQPLLPLHPPYAAANFRGGGAAAAKGCRYTEQQQQLPPLLPHVVSSVFPPPLLPPPPVLISPSINSYIPTPYGLAAAGRSSSHSQMLRQQPLLPYPQQQWMCQQQQQQVNSGWRRGGGAGGRQQQHGGAHSVVVGWNGLPLQMGSNIGSGNLPEYNVQNNSAHAYAPDYANQQGLLRGPLLLTAVAGATYRPAAAAGGLLPGDPWAQQYAAAASTAPRQHQQPTPPWQQQRGDYRRGGLQSWNFRSPEK